MFYQQVMKPKELLAVLNQVNECFFVIQAKLPTHFYRVAIYKYDQEYFLLQDQRLFEQMHRTDDETQGDDNEVLPFIEEALENNLFQLIDEAYIRLDLSIIAKIKAAQGEVRYYEFIDI